MKPKGARSVSAPAPTQEPDPGLAVFLIFTTFGTTRSALVAAKHFADGLGLRLILLVPQVVPYPLPLESPPVPGEFFHKMLEQLASGSETPIEVRRYLCRNRDETVRQAVFLNSIVLIGTRGRLRGWSDRRLGRQLALEGCQVLFIDVNSVRR